MLVSEKIFDTDFIQTIQMQTLELFALLHDWLETIWSDVETSTDIQLN